MKSRLFIFAIGGTGSRVVKALTMLLAAGVDIKARQVIPIIIDPDSTNGDMKRTIEILKLYNRIRKKLTIKEGKSKFFQTEIGTLRSLSEDGDGASSLSEVYRYSIDGSKEGRFREFIDYSSLDEANRAFVDLLYSSGNLNLRLDEGFKGHPNIGAVVLNQYKDSHEFRNFAAEFSQNDRIFIVSSIFGGTGAAGFPLMLKNFRNAKSEIATNSEFLRNARIGALTVLPYFSVAPQKGGMIDTDTFNSKAKAALSYYKRNIIDNRSLNALYYIGDDISQSYDYAEGQESQKNKAHLVEMIGALAIINFMNTANGDLETRNGKAVAPLYKEFGLRDVADPLFFKHLPLSTTRRLFSPLTQYAYFCLYMRQQFDRSLNKQPWSNRGNVKIDREFKQNSPFFDNVNRFNRHYWDWLKEMAGNKRGFMPFNLNAQENTLDSFVNGIEQKRGWFGFGKSWDYGDYDSRLNKAEQRIGDQTVEDKFIQVFYDATRGIMEDKFANL